jgi:polysaccharide pyruvyl transferase CsaB
MRVTVAAWIGAGNLGDELLFTSLRRELEMAGLTPIALSLDPAATRRLHGVPSVSHTAIVGALRRSAGLVFGGGGLVQDQTSLLSPLYQLARPVAARLLDRPTVAVGLGAEPLRAPSSRIVSRLGLRRALAVVARDLASVEALRAVHVRAELGADLAFLLEPPTGVALRDELVVSLRPRFPRGGLLPGRLRQRQPDQGDFATEVAVQLDRLAGATGLRVAFLSMEPGRDDLLHRQVAERLRGPARWLRPEPSELLATIAGARLVIASRFHAGVGAVATGRPAILLGYAPKVRALGADVGRGVRLLDRGTRAMEDLAATSSALIDSDERPPAAARASLRRRALRNRVAVERLAAELRSDRRST